MKSPLYPEQELRRRVAAWSVKLRVSPRLLRIQTMTRKWGSCSSSGTVTLAKDLIDHNDKFQDYVIVHELLHLRYGTHGRMFRSLMSAHIPDWKQIDAERRTSPGKRNLRNTRRR